MITVYVTTSVINCFAVDAMFTYWTILYLVII